MQGAGRPSCLGFPLAQDRYPVGHSQGFFQFMGDEDQAFTLLFKQAKQRKKPLGFFGAENRGRLIENQVPDIPKQEGKDRGFLPLAYGEIRHIPV
jgi:hypothetical protein